MTTLEASQFESVLGSLGLAALPVIPSADVLRKPLDIYRGYLAEILGHLVDCTTEAAYEAIQWPNNIFNGDLAVILPKLYPGAKADALAIDLMKKFPRGHPLFPLPFSEGVHLRIFFHRQTLGRILLPYILDRKAAYGDDASLGLGEPGTSQRACKKLVVEFSSPNIYSEFQGKHLRSTILGAFVSTLYERMGWHVTRINYLGDWGKDIALLKVGWEIFGNEDAYQTDPVGHLLHVYHMIRQEFLPLQAASRRARDEAAKVGHVEGVTQVDIESHGLFARRNATFKKLEEGDEKTVAFWKRERDAAIENYTDFYGRLGIKFDEYTGESQVKHETMAEVEQMLKDKGLCEESGGAWIVHMQKCGLKAGTAVIRDRTGAPLYLLRDLAAVLERSRKFEFDKMIFVVANDNSAHFTQLFKILEALDMHDLAKKLHHLKFSEVSRMAEKLGTGYKPQAIIQHCEEAMLSALNTDQEKAALFGPSEEAAKALAVCGLLTQELSTRTATAHNFDTVAMTSFKTGTGPDFQYWYARLRSVLKDHPAPTELSDDDYDALDSDEPANLLRVLAQYPEVTHATYHSLEPAGIVTYLASVVEQLADCLDDQDDESEGQAQADGEQEEKPEEEATRDPEAAKNEACIPPAYVVLYEATRVVLETGMKLLGLTPIVNLEPTRADTPVAE